MNHMIGWIKVGSLVQFDMTTGSKWTSNHLAGKEAGACTCLLMMISVTRNTLVVLAKEARERQD